MRELIYESRRSNGRIAARAWLSSEHSASHYGQPVLIVKIGKEEEVVGWSDVLPSGLSGADFLDWVASCPAVNHAVLTAVGREALEALLVTVRAWRVAR